MNEADTPAGGSNRDFERRTANVVSWFWKGNLEKSNHYCLYCYRFIGPGSEIASNKEHLIGREFVPKGYLDGDSFNFIFRACVDCNGSKSDQERHVSSVTLAASPARAVDPVVNEIAARKARRDFHPLRKGVVVANATEKLTLKGSMGAVQMTHTLVGPPPLDEHRALGLAARQIQALFSMLTTRDPRKESTTSILRPDCWRWYGCYSSDDWGNPELMELQDRAKAWPIMFAVTAARGFFRAIIRKRASPPEELFWALEWNKRERIVGAICAPGTEPDLFKDLPEEEWIAAPDGFRMRFQLPMPEDRDELFSYPGDGSG
jgi:hypothetical protein